MDKAKLSRRQILAGLAVTGSSGALVGSGTSALFSDTETFANNAIDASKNVAGVVDLDVDIYDDDTELKFCVNLPEVQEEFGNSEEFGNTKDLSTNNNPTHVWVRTKTCPKIEEDTVEGKEISWIALCGTDIDDSEVTLNVTGRNGDDEATKVHWEVSGDATVGLVTHKTGGGSDEIYKTEFVSNQNSGEIVSGEGTKATKRTNPDYCPPDGKKENTGIKYDDIEKKAVETGSVKVNVYIDCAEGRKTLATEADILDVVTSKEFREGILLECGEENECLQVGEERCLIIEPTSSFSDINLAEFELEFYAQQCRYNGDPENPFDPGEVLGKAECEGDDEVDVDDISFIAFCRENGSFEVENLQKSESSVNWKTDDEVDYVVVFGGGHWTIYDYSSGSGEDDAIATLDDKGAAFNDVLIFPSSYCSGNAQSCPCEVASQELGNSSFPDKGGSIKYESCNGTLKPESECE